MIYIGFPPVDDSNPASLYIYGATITPRVLVDFGTKSHAGFLSSTDFLWFGGVGGRSNSNFLASTPSWTNPFGQLPRQRRRRGWGGGLNRGRGRGGACGCQSSCSIWEFQKIRGPEIDPKIVRFLCEDQIRRSQQRLVSGLQSRVLRRVEHVGAGSSK